MLLAKFVLKLEIDLEIDFVAVKAPMFSFTRLR